MRIDNYKNKLKRNGAKTQSGVNEMFKPDRSAGIFANVSQAFANGNQTISNNYQVFADDYRVSSNGYQTPTGNNQGPSSNNQISTGYNQAPADNYQVSSNNNQAPADDYQVSSTNNQTLANDNQALSNDNQALANDYFVLFFNRLIHYFRPRFFNWRGISLPGKVAFACCNANYLAPFHCFPAFLSANAGQNPRAICQRMFVLQYIQQLINVKFKT